MLFLGIIRYEQYYDELVAYGDFPTPEGRLACFPRAKPGCTVLFIPAAKPPTTTLGPSGAVKPENSRAQPCQTSGPWDPSTLTPKGETTHYDLRVALLLHPLLSLTHWIFRSLPLPYKSSSLVQLMFAVHARKGVSACP